MVLRMLLTVVTSDKGIAIVSPLGAIDILIRLFERNVHVAIDGLQFACENSQGGVE